MATTTSDDEAQTGFRVEELSARTGVPVRTIREYQTWQILHPPTRVGRVGHYDQSHVKRLEDIARLQARGYSIAAIRDLFDSWERGAGLDDVLGVEDAIGSPADEAPMVLTLDQLAAVLPAVVASDRLFARARSAGIVAEHDDGYVARSPALLQLVADAIAAGSSPTAAIDLGAAVVDAASELGEIAATSVMEQLMPGGGATGSGTTDDGPASTTEALLRRGRVLLARAVATHTIDQVGRNLLRLAEDDAVVAALVDEVRIGTFARPPSRASRVEHPRA